MPTDGIANIIFNHFMQKMLVLWSELLLESGPYKLLQLTEVRLISRCEWIIMRG